MSCKYADFFLIFIQTLHCVCLNLSANSKEDYVIYIY